MNQTWIGPFRPTPRRLVLLPRKDAYGDRNGDALGVEEASVIFPIQARRRDPRIRQPVERDVVKDLVPREFACGARRSVKSRGEGGGRLAAPVAVIQEPGGEPDR